MDDRQYESLQRDIDRAHHRARLIEAHVGAIEEWHRLLPIRLAIGVSGAVGVGLVGTLVVNALHR